VPAVTALGPERALPQLPTLPPRAFQARQPRGRPAGTQSLLGAQRAARASLPHPGEETRSLPGPAPPRNEARALGKGFKRAASRGPAATRPATPFGPGRTPPPVTA